MTALMRRRGMMQRKSAEWKTVELITTVEVGTRTLRVNLTPLLLPTEITEAAYFTLERVSGNYSLGRLNFSDRGLIHYSYYALPKRSAFIRLDASHFEIMENNNSAGADMSHIRQQNYEATDTQYFGIYSHWTTDYATERTVFRGTVTYR